MLNCVEVYPTFVLNPSFIYEFVDVCIKKWFYLEPEMVPSPLHICTLKNAGLF